MNLRSGYIVVASGRQAEIVVSSSAFRMLYKACDIYYSAENNAKLFDDYATLFCPALYEIAASCNYGTLRQSGPETSFISRKSIERRKSFANKGPSQEWTQYCLRQTIAGEYKGKFASIDLFTANLLNADNAIVGFLPLYAGGLQQICQIFYPKSAHYFLGRFCKHVSLHTRNSEIALYSPHSLY